MDFVLIAFMSQIVLFYFLIVGYEFARQKGILAMRNPSVPKPIKQEEIWRKAS